MCCHHDLFPFRATGLRRTDRRQVMSFFCFLFFSCATTFCLSCCTRARWTSTSIGLTCSRRRFPRHFVDFFSVLCVLWRFASSGLVGFPLLRFVPLVFSLVLGGRVGDFRHLLRSCIFLCRISLGKPGRPACKPPGPCRPFPWPVPPFPSPAGSRRRYGSRERAAG